MLSTNLTPADHELAKRQIVPSQDQSPLFEMITSDGNILQFYQTMVAGISNIYARVMNGTTGVTIGNPLAITNSTTQHQIWPQASPWAIYFINTKDNHVYYQPYIFSNNAVILQGGATKLNPLGYINGTGQQWINNYIAMNGIGLPHHFSINLDLSTNRTYLFEHTLTYALMTNALAGAYIDWQGTVTTNGVLNNTADYPSVSGQGLGCTVGSNLIYYQNSATQTTSLIIQTGLLGNGANRLRIGKLTDGSRVFVWQRLNADNTWDVLTRQLSADNVTWLDANEILVYTLAAGNGDPQPNIIADTNGSFYIVGKDSCSTGTLGICTRKYQGRGIFSPAISEIANAQANFPTGSFVNGKLWISACDLTNSSCRILTVLSSAPTIFNSSASGTLSRSPTTLTSSSNVASSILTSSSNSTTSTNLLLTSNTISSTESITTNAASNLNSLITGMSSSSASTPTTLTSNNSLPPQLMSDGKNSSSESRLSSAAIGGIAAGAVLFFLYTLAMGLFIWRKTKNPKRKKRSTENNNGGAEMGAYHAPVSSPKSTYANVRQAMAGEYDRVDLKQPHEYEQPGSPLGQATYDQLPKQRTAIQYDQSLPVADADNELPADGISVAAPRH